MKRCSQCGTDNADGNLFCISCGTRMAEPAQGETGPVGSLPQGPMTVGRDFDESLQPAAPKPPPVQSAGSNQAPLPPPSAPTPSTAVPPPADRSLPPVAPPRSVVPTQVIPPPTPGAVQYQGPKSQMGLAALILGILSLLSCACWWVSPIAGIIAIICAMQARKDPGADQGMATAGLIMGIIGLAIGAIVLIAGLLGGE